MAEPIPAEKAREQFMHQLAALAKYWADQTDQSPLDRCNGLAFSVLNLFDGTSMELPAMDIVLRPHPDDEQFHKDEGTDWFVDGQVINEDMLHEQWHKYQQK